MTGDEDLPAKLYQPLYIPPEFMHPTSPLNPTYPSPRYSPTLNDFQRRYGSTINQSIPMDLGYPVHSYLDSSVSPGPGPWVSPASPANFDGEGNSERMSSPHSIPQIEVQSPSPLLEWPGFQLPSPPITKDNYYPEGPILSFDNNPRSSSFTPGSTPWVPTPGFTPETFKPSTTLSGLLPDDYSNPGMHARWSLKVNCTM